MLLNKISISVFFILLSQIYISAQSKIVPQINAYLFDNTSYIRADMSENPRIDRAVSEIKNQPGAKLAIIAYGLPGLAIRRMNAVVKHQTQSHGVSENQLVDLYGGYEAGLRFELWVVPKGAEVPEVKSDLPSDAYIYDRINVEEGEPSNDLDFPRPIDGFGRFLQNNTDANAYLVYYSSHNENFPVSVKYARKKANQTKMMLIRKFNVKTSNIFSVLGGSNDYGTVELWFVPKGAKPPTTSKN